MEEKVSGWWCDKEKKVGGGSKITIRPGGRGGVMSYEDREKRVRRKRKSCAVEACYPKDRRSKDNQLGTKKGEG